MSSALKLTKVSFQHSCQPLSGGNLCNGTEKVPESQLNETSRRYYTVITQLYGAF